MPREKIRLDERKKGIGKAVSMERFEISRERINGGTDEKEDWKNPNLRGLEICLLGMSLIFVQGK